MAIILRNDIEVLNLPMNSYQRVSEDVKLHGKLIILAMITLLIILASVPPRINWFRIMIEPLLSIDCYLIQATYYLREAIHYAT